MDPEKRIAIDQLRSRYPMLGVTRIRELLEANRWNVQSALQAAEKAASQGKGDNNFFVGGGDHGSGQHVVGRTDEAMHNSNSNNANDGVGGMVDSIFNQAKSQSAAGASADEGSLDQQAFYGKGRRLGHTENPSPFVASTLRQKRSITISVYRNGVRVEDGPLISIDSPEGHELLSAMEQGYVPNSLLSKYPDCDLMVNLNDCLNTDYREEAVHVAFQGAGHRMSSTAAAAATSASASSYEKDRPFAYESTEPSSFIRIVKTNGERKEFQVNPSRHTVEDVYYLAHTVQPELGKFLLVVRDMPPRKLTDDTRAQTIEAAKLQRSVIAIQNL